MTGQMDAREDRMQETANWLNAVPAGAALNELMEADEVNPDFVKQEVAFIRSCLAAGDENVDCLNIDCFASRYQAVDAIIAELTDAELARVSFPMREHMPFRVTA